MKKSFLFLSLAAVFIACGDSKDAAKIGATTGNADSTNVETPKDPEATKGLQLIAQSDCLTCHNIKDYVNGPAYEEIAAKYDNNPAVVDSLAQKIIKGGAGNWGKAAMTAHPDISQEDARTMVKYVLSLKP